MTDPLETPEGQRIVEAMAKALHDAQFVRDAGDGQPAIRVLPDEEAATVALRAALSVTGECKTCGGTRTVLNQDDVGERSLGSPCPDYPGEPLLVLREQAVTTEGTNGP